MMPSWITLLVLAIPVVFAGRADDGPCPCVEDAMSRPDFSPACHLYQLGTPEHILCETDEALKDIFDCDRRYGTTHYPDTSVFRMQIRNQALQGYSPFGRVRREIILTGGARPGCEKCGQAQNQGRAKAQGQSQGHGQSQGGQLEFESAKSGSARSTAVRTPPADANEMLNAGQAASPPPEVNVDNVPLLLFPLPNSGTSVAPPPGDTPPAPEK